jgi:hypothetical protein
MIGRIERVPLREVWKHEAYSFTVWLRDNIEVLNDVIDVTIANVEREQSAGSFSVDLVGEDESGQPVVIENQLEKSDHDHLGKLITYLTAFEAKTAVWIVADPRPEHIAAIAWLNQTTPVSFYLVKVEAIQIGSSEPAPLLTKIVGPSAESREVGEKKKGIAERHDLRLAFWEGLLDRARQRTQLHATLSPSAYHWIGTSYGRSNVLLNYVIRRRDGHVEFYIGRKDPEENYRIFGQLYERRAEIEAEFGDHLDWVKQEGNLTCKIKKDVPAGGYHSPQEEWPTIFDALIDAMIRLERSVGPAFREVLG